MVQNLDRFAATFGDSLNYRYTPKIQKAWLFRTKNKMATIDVDINSRHAGGSA